MKLLFLILISLFQHFTCFKKHKEVDTSTCSNPNILPKSDSVGVATDLLYLDKKDNIFDFSCFNRQYDLEGQYLIPDGLKYEPLLLMQQQNETFLAENQLEFNEIKIQTTRTIIKNSEEYKERLNKVAGALNPNITIIENYINHDNVVFQKLTTTYAQSRAYIHDFSSLQLTNEIRQAILQLPTVYDEDQYRQFIVKYGTHFSAEVEIGGLIEQTGYTNRTYTQDHTRKQIGNNFLKNFVHEEQQRHFSVNHIPTELLDSTPPDSYLDNTRFGEFFVKGGNWQSLEGWVGSLKKDPVVTWKTLVNMTEIMTDNFFPGNPNITTVRGHTGTAIKAYLIDSQGCVNKQAINFDKNAVVSDNSCYFTVFDGSYQTASADSCTQAQQDTYQLDNPRTNDIRCSEGSQAKKVAVYDYDGCVLTQYFCMRNDHMSVMSPDLSQSLQICENRTVTDVFYEQKVPQDQQQYQCNITNNSQDRLFFDFRNNQARQMNTCLQQFCYDGNTEGVHGFVNRYHGTCQGYSEESLEDNIFDYCADGCLIMYGKVQVAHDCDIQQFICINWERNIKCFNN